MWIYFLCVAIDCPLWFKDVGSLIADEVTEEQADTERSDQEMKYASHT